MNRYILAGLGLFIACAMALIGCTTDSTTVDLPESSVTILPAPSSYLETASKAYLLGSNDRIAADSAFQNEANYLIAELHPFVGDLKLVAGYADGASIRILQKKDITAPEAYRLRIDQSGIEIHAGSRQGAFYALQTVLQLQHSDAQKPGTMAFLFNEITDEPRFQHRGMLLDCCRHYMEPEFIKRYLDLLARYKMNVFHWHLTEDQGWRFESLAYPLLTEVGAWRKHPDGGAYGGFYSQEVMREIVAYAAERHIKVVPEIELPGHSSAAIASYPWLSCTGEHIPVETEWGVFKDIYCAGNDSTVRFLETIFDEVLSIFPSDIVHIGGDEAPKTRWEACQKCQKRITDEGLHDEHELQGWFVNHFKNYLNARGRTLMGWDEILEGGDAMISDAPSNEQPKLIVQSWRGMQGGKTAAENSVGAVMSPTSHAYFDYDIKSTDLEEVYSFDPVPDGLHPEQARFILGGECNMWTEHAPQHSIDGKVFPRILAMAEVLWTYPEKRDYERFKARVKSEYPRLDSLGVEYGPASLSFEVLGMDGDPLSFRVTAKSSPDSTAYRWNSTAWMELPPDGWLHVPDTLDGRGRLQLKAVEGRLVDTFTVEFAQHNLRNTSISLQHPYSPYYTGGGDNALSDGILGSYDFRDGHWQGFSGANLEAIYELASPLTLQRVTVPFYTYSNAWIFLPVEVEVFGSNDGKRWDSLGLSRNPLAEDDKRQAIVEITVETNTTTAYNRLKVVAKNRGKNPAWHDAPGEPAWLFASEIIVLAN